MRLFLEIKNKKAGVEEVGFVSFNIATSYSPTNLWILKDQGVETEYGKQTHNFFFKKVVAVMEVVTNIASYELHGQVITCADGEYNKLNNLLITLRADSENFYWHQPDNEFEENLANEHVYLIDLDELRQSKGFEHLSVENCFRELLTNSSMDFDLRKYRFIDLQTGKIMDINEHIPE